MCIVFKQFYVYSFGNPSIQKENSNLTSKCKIKMERTIHSLAILNDIGALLEHVWGHIAYVFVGSCFGPSCGYLGQFEASFGPSWDHLGKTWVCHFGGVMIGRLTSMAALAYLTYIASRTHDRFLQVWHQSAWHHSTAAMVLNTSWNNRLCDLVLCRPWPLFSFKGFVVMFG